VVGTPDTAVLRARVTVENLTMVEATGATTVSNSIRADLIDTSQALQKPRLPGSFLLSPGCYGLTGQPVTECRPGVPEPCTVEKLDAEKIEVTGLAGGGVISLVRRSKGTFDYQQIPSPLFGDGFLTVRITGRANEAGWFPTMELQVQQPRPLVLKEPLGGKPLGAGDVKIRWEPGSADLIVLNASLSPPKQEADDVQCVIADDGCSTLVAGDLDSYDIKVGSQLKLQVIRDNSRILNEGNVSMEVKAVSRVQLVLTR
jgi:hypothetical protein